MGYMEIDIDSGKVEKQPPSPTTEEQQPEPSVNPGIEIGPDIQILPVVPDGHLIEQVRDESNLIIQQIERSVEAT